MSSKRTVALLWACFCVRALFYSTVLPLWEGFDEYSHVAYLDHLALRKETPARDTLVSREIVEWIQRVPVPRHLKDQFPNSAVTYDEYWSMAAGRRQAISSRSTMHEQVRIYEAQQPPLYYTALAIPYRALRNLTITDRVWILRLISALIASIMVPLTFVLGRMVLPDDAQAIGAVSIAAAMPELYITVSRVSNEALAVACGAVVLTLAVTALRRFRTSLALALGGALGMALLTKAYFLAVSAAVLGALAWLTHEFKKVALAAALALVISGWWYVDAYRQTGSWSGEQNDAAVQRAGTSLVNAIVNADWIQAIDSTFVSHIWFGGWSFLQARSWMYRVFAALFLLSALGIAFRVRRREITILLIGYSALLAALAYHVVLNTIVHQQSVTTGWYLYSLISAEAVLLTAGLSSLGPMKMKRHAAAVLCGCFLALELFAIHLYQLPYYAGLTRHAISGGLPALHLDQLAGGGLGELIQRTTLNKPSWVSPVSLVVLWCGYMIASGVVLWVAVRQGRVPSTGSALSQPHRPL